MSTIRARRPKAAPATALFRLLTKPRSAFPFLASAFLPAAIVSVSGIATAARAATVVTYPAPSGAAIHASEKYSVTVDGGSGQQPVFAYRFDSYSGLNQHLATFDHDGPVTVRVKKLGGNINSCVVRPLSANISVSVSGDTATFTVPSPRNLCVELDGDRDLPLYLFTNPLETDIPAPNTPGILYLGPGYHQLGRQDINQSVYLAGGAILVGGNLYADKIWGRGILAGDKNFLFGIRSDGSEDRGSQARIWRGGSNKAFKDFILVRPMPGWHFGLDGLKDSTITNVRILADEPSDDGIDMISCENVTIDNVFIRVKDDCIAIKNYNADFSKPEGEIYFPGRDTRNITIKNSVFSNGVWGNNLEIGVETVGGTIDGILFKNNDLIHTMGGSAPTDAALSIHLGGDTAIKNVTYDDLRIENLDPNSPLIQALMWQSSEYSFGRPRGSITNLTYKNIKYTGSSKPIIHFQGFGPNNAVTNVTFDNFLIGGQPVTGINANQAKWIIGDHVNNIRFGANATEGYSSPANGWGVRSWFSDRLSYYLIDGDLETKWAANDTKKRRAFTNVENDWFAVNLGYKQGNARTFDSLKITGLENREYPGWELFLSPDGTNWGSPISTSLSRSNIGGGKVLDTVTFPAQTAKYVKVRATGATLGEYYLPEIFEVQILNGGSPLDLSFNPVTPNSGGNPGNGNAYNGPHNVPGTVQAEDYDSGGQGNAYNDNDSSNNGNQYRVAEGVDVENCSLGGYNVGWINAGEWLKYTVNVGSAGTYKMDASVASLNGVGSFHIEDDSNNNLTGSIPVPNTNNWQNWVTVSSPNFTLPAGAKTLRVVIETGGFNLNALTFSAATAGTVATPTFSPAPGTYTSAQSVTLSSATSGSTIRYTTNGSNPSATTGTVYSGAIPVSSTTTIKAIAVKSGMTDSGVASGSYTISAPSGGSAYDGPHNIPGLIQGEDFDNGGQGVGYSDVTGSNEGGQYRTDQAVDIENCSEGGFNVGWTNGGEWLKYTVNVAAAGSYTLQVRYASDSAGGSFHLEDANGTNLTGSITAGYTGGWQSWQTATAANVSLPAGTTTLKLVIDTGGFNINSLNFVSGTPSAAVAAPTFSPAPGSYSSAQSVTLATTTSGATIRYTTDGSNPTATSGTVYGGAINVASNTTIKAIAYKSGMTDSPVSSGSYTISAGATVYNYEVESLPQEANCPTGPVSDGAASGGSHIVAQPGQVWEWSRHTVNVPVAGNYKVVVRGKTGSDRGKMRLEIDDNVMGTWNQYAASSGAFVEYTYINSVSLTAGNHVFMFKSDGVGGENGLKMSADKITLTKQ